MFFFWGILRVTHTQTQTDSCPRNVSPNRRFCLQQRWREQRLRKVDSGGLWHVSSPGATRCFTVTQCSFQTNLVWSLFKLNFLPLTYELSPFLWNTNPRELSEWPLPIGASFMANWLRVPTPLVPIAFQSRGSLCLPPPDKRVNKTWVKGVELRDRVPCQHSNDNWIFCRSNSHSGSPFCSPSFGTHVTGCDHRVRAKAHLTQTQMQLYSGESCWRLDCNKKQISAGERIRVACWHVRRDPHPRLNAIIL